MSVIKVIVFHTYYGCETGCCGHAVRVSDDDSDSYFGFEFGDSPGDGSSEEQRKAWAKEFAQKAVISKYGEGHVADLDWENCTILNDC